jgi:hypothetical protein
MKENKKNKNFKISILNRFKNLKIRLILNQKKEKKKNKKLNKIKRKNKNCTKNYVKK